mgnify:CR=1 FL=1
MNNTIITTNSETITSMEVAQMIDKEHKYLLRDIRRYLNQIEKINDTKFNQTKIAPVDFFIENTYTDNKGEIRPCYNITHKGCEFIANKLTGIKGTEFTARYVIRFHELEEGNITNILISTMKNISDTMLGIQKSTNERLDKLENCLKESSEKKKLPPKKHSRWKTNIFSKLTTLMEYTNTNSDQNLTLPNTIHLTLEELQDTYDIEFNDYVEAYKSEYGLDITPYTIDVIDHYKDIRKLYTYILDNRLNQFGLIQETTLKKNIFDILAENISAEKL